MKDEIKEILDKLETVAGKHTIEVREDGSKIERMSAYAVNELRLNNFSSKILLDYITNLQQIEQDHQKLNGELREELEDYKSRCEKISNLILEKVRDTALYGEADLSLETLLNIANGGDK